MSILINSIIINILLILVIILVIIISSFFGINNKGLDIAYVNFKL